VKNIQTDDSRPGSEWLWELVLVATGSIVVSTVGFESEQCVCCSWLWTLTYQWSPD